MCSCKIMPGLCEAWAVAHQDPLFIEFFRQEYWRVLPFPTPKCLPHRGIKPVSLASPALTGGLFTPAPLHTLKDKWWKDSRRRNEDFKSIHLKVYISKYIFVLEKSKRCINLNSRLGLNQWILHGGWIHYENSQNILCFLISKDKKKERKLAFGDMVYLVRGTPTHHHLPQPSLGFSNHFSPISPLKGTRNRHTSMVGSI